MGSAVETMACVPQGRSGLAGLLERIWTYQKANIF